jgi:hypothetical protein
MMRMRAMPVSGSDDGGPGAEQRIRAMALGCLKIEIAISLPSPSRTRVYPSSASN